MWEQQMMHCICFWHLRLNEQWEIFFAFFSLLYFKVENTIVVVSFLRSEREIEWSLKCWPASGHHYVVACLTLWSNNMQGIWEQRVSFLLYNCTESFFKMFFRFILKLKQRLSVFHVHRNWPPPPQFGSSQIWSV